ncbi:MAG TPA: peptidylprolyl isomerase [Chthoniobacterales bacterium]
MIRLLLFLTLFAALARANDLAVIAIKLPDEKTPRNVTVELFNNDAPNTVANFEKLARRKFYKNIAFHRAFPNKMVQTGDPASRHKKSNIAVGVGGPGYTVPAEIKRRHVRGSVAMGRLPDKINPNKASNGSQFYVTLAPMPKLDGEYTVFGQVTDGLDVLEKISRQTADSNDSPVDRVYIKSVTVYPAAAGAPQAKVD